MKNYQNSPMKIVHVEDFIHPDAGYQVNLLSRLQQAEGHDVTVVTAELDKVPSFLTAFFGKDDIPKKDLVFERETGVRILRVPLLGFYSGRAIFHPRLFKTVAELKPDVVFVHGEDTLTGMLFILFSKWLKYPIVLDCHMLEMASVNRFREYFRAFYRRFITPIILRENIPLIRVVDSDYVQKCLGIPLSHTDLLSFGTDTAYFSPNSEVREAVRAKYGFNEDTFLVLYAGKLDETKGGGFLAEAIQQKFSSESGRPIEFMIIGNSDGTYGEEVERVFLSSENKIVRLPTQRYYDLAPFYQAADLAVFPRQCSMSFFEAQSCGLPILFEENEINSQRASFENAFLFAPGNVENFRSKILSLSSSPRDWYAKIRENARNYVFQSYDYVPIAKRFTEVLQRAVTAWQQKATKP
jgi:glycosyltransferase involved in cell wall biosynthesis